jgi:ketosteroid isomerase-like protein
MTNTRDKSTTHTASEPTSSPREMLARYHDAMLHWSADELADLYAVDAIHEFPHFAPGRPARSEGREQVRAGYRAAWGASAVRLEAIRNVVVYETTDPEVIIAEQDIAAVVTTTGERFTASFLLVLRVRDGRIVHVRDYQDSLGVAYATGRLPALVASLGASRPEPPHAQG